MIIFQDPMLSPFYIVYTKKVFNIYEKKIRVKKDFLELKKLKQHIPPEGQETYASHIGYYTSIDEALSKISRLLLERNHKKEVVQIKTYISMYLKLKIALKEKFAGI